MGAPKQKWTEEEETALKAGVSKYGSGKWQAILKDPDFSHILSSRSNVDLKDKWRNINVTLSGLGSREKARLALKRNPQIPKHSRKPVALNSLVPGEEEEEEEEVTEARAVESNPHAVSSFSDKLHVAASKRKSTRLESIILEALTNLKEPKGSEKNAIATYIEEQYSEPPNFTKLSTKLKSMTLKGKLLKVKHRYRISPCLTPSETRTKSSLDGKQKDIHKVEKNGVRIFQQPQVDEETEDVSSMAAHEAAATAARAIAEAEAAIADAAKAEMEAAAAEAEAEAARDFAKAAMKLINS